MSTIRRKVRIIENKQVTLESIHKIVCEDFGVHYEILIRENRARPRKIVLARQIVMYFAEAFTTNSLGKIAKYFRKYDHSIVNRSCKAVEKFMDTDNAFYDKVVKLDRKIRAYNNTQPEITSFV